MKWGIEVEGTYKGAPTIFIDIGELRDLVFNFKSLDDKYAISHIYISDHKNKFNYVHFNLIGKLLYYYKRRVFIECTKIPTYPDDLLKEIDFVLYIQNENFFHLKKTDQIKFEKNLNVYATLKSNFESTKPSDFEGDINIKL